MFCNCFKQALFVLMINCAFFCTTNANAQSLDLTEKPSNSHIISIIPVPSSPKGIYSDSTNYTANYLTEKLRTLPNWQTLNVLNSLRYLESTNTKKYLDRVYRSYMDSYTPDPDDLNKIAKTLGADKIILIYGTFDTQAGFLNKSKKSMFNPLDDNALTPLYKYNTTVTLYDPETGIIEWSKTYNKSFHYKTSYMVDKSMATNTTFLNEFNKFSGELSADTLNELNLKYFYNESTTVKSKLLLQGSDELTKEGIMTKDGHLHIPESKDNHTALPKKEPEYKYINKVIDANTPKKSEDNINNNFKSELIQHTDKEIFNGR